MSDPRYDPPGEHTYMVTRRVAQRELRLTPTDPDPAKDRVRRASLFCLAWAAALAGIEVHAAIVLGNHWHGIVTDRTSSLSSFCHRLHLYVAKLLNVAQNRGENFWAARRFSMVRLVNPEDVLDKLVYVLTNAVKDGLVDRLEDWPGLHTTPEDIGLTVLVAERPEWFFRAPRGDEPETSVPSRVELRVTKPPMFDHLSDAEFRDLLRRRVNERLAEIRRQRLAEGKTRSLGPAAVLAQAPFSRPGWSSVDRGVTPRVACRGSLLRDAKGVLTKLGGGPSSEGVPDVRVGNGGDRTEKQEAGERAACAPDGRPSPTRPPTAKLTQLTYLSHPTNLPLSSPQ